MVKENTRAREDVADRVQKNTQLWAVPLVNSIHTVPHHYSKIFIREKGFLSADPGIPLVRKS